MASGSSEADAGKKTVMICDDEEDLLKVYSTFLKKKFNIITANTGESCLDLYRAEKEKGRKVDVLLLDYRLGDTSGDKVACQIREMDGTKTILMTAYEVDEGILADLKKRDCIVLRIRKPASLAMVAEKIEELLP